MFAYATVGSSDFEASLKFFDATLSVLGYTRLQEYLDVGWVAYGNPQDASNPANPMLWLNKTPFNGEKATVGNGSMVAFSALTRKQVDEFYAVALANGGSSEGAPGTREAYGPELYLAYVRDPMGNKFSVVTRST
jgi:catechol 2,3-dioxygenase-like lactoylglutathione lyase family enzyme